MQRHCSLRRQALGDAVEDKPQKFVLTIECISIFGRKIIRSTFRFFTPILPNAKVHAKNYISFLFQISRKMRLA